MICCFAMIWVQIGKNHIALSFGAFSQTKMHNKGVSFPKAPGHDATGQTPLAIYYPSIRLLQAAAFFYTDIFLVGSPREITSSKSL